jgi:hypothetical protein
MFSLCLLVAVGGVHFPLFGGQIHKEVPSDLKRENQFCVKRDMGVYL